jgi:hypothetical protein
MAEVKKGISYAQVVDAASAIKARGHEPTGYAIRAELGGTGSFTTIQAHLAKWKDSSAQQVTTRDLPPEVENAMHLAIATAWNVATKLADESTAAVRQDCEDRLKANAAILDGADALIAELEAKLLVSVTDQAQIKTTVEATLRSEAKLQGQYQELKARYDDLLALTPRASGKVVALGTKSARSGKKAASRESTPGAVPGAH